MAEAALPSAVVKPFQMLCVTGGFADSLKLLTSAASIESVTLQVVVETTAVSKLIVPI